MRISSAARVAVVLAVLGALVVPGQASAAPSKLVVEGSRSAYVDFAVAQTMHRDFNVEVTGGRSYVAVFISSVDAASPRLMGVLRAGALSADPVLFGSTSLPPGRYRARLLTDAPARVTFQLSAPNGQVLRPGNPIRTLVQTAGVGLSPGRSDAKVTVASAIPSAWLGLIGGRVTGQRVEQTYQCATAGQGSCPGVGRLEVLGDYDGLYVPSNSSTPVVTGVFAQPQRRDALLGVNGYRTSSGDLRAFVLSFDR